MNEKKTGGEPSLFRNKGVVTGMVIVSVLSIGAIIWAVSSTPAIENPIEDRNNAPLKGAAGTVQTGKPFDNGNVRVEWNPGPKPNVIDNSKKTAPPPPTGKAGRMY